MIKYFIGNISESDRINFCYIHFGELSIIPSGLANNYPFVINFDQLPNRICKFKDNLLEIINGSANSYYLDFAKQSYYNIGHKKTATPMILMNRFQILRVSYFVLSLLVFLN